MVTRARASLLGVAVLLLLAAALLWALAPRLATPAIDRMLAGCPDGIVASRGRIEHAGLGLAVRDVALVGASGTVARADAVRVVPAADWPPIAVEIDALRVSSAGAAAFAGAAAKSPGFAESARTFTKRQYGNLHTARIALRAVDARVDLGEGRGDVELPRARGAFLVEDPTHARLVLARDDGNAGLAAGVEATQDAATLRLEALAPGAPGEPTLWQWHARIPAPEWAGLAGGEDQR